MTIINNIEQKQQILKFLTFMRKKQEDIQKESFEKIVFSVINLKTAIKHKLLLNSLLTHKLLLRTRFFYEDNIEVIELKELLSLLKQVLEYELTVDLKQASINSEDIAKIIKVTQSLETKIFKKENKQKPNV